jgi:hypothetical protein
MYTFDLPVFLYSENARGERFSGQHTICFHILLFLHFAVFLSKYCVDRFFLWWLFLHRRLRSRQRGSFGFRFLSDFCSFLVVPCQKVLFVFIRTTRKSFSTLSRASLSASIQGVIATNFRLSLLSNNASPLSFASPCTGQTPVSILTVEAILHSFFFLSRGKIIENTLSFGLILQADFKGAVENFTINLWKNLWKTLQPFSFANLKIRMILDENITACVKPKKSL